MRMAIMGAGSLGTILGALLTKNGYDVDLIKRSKKDVELFNTEGAKIVGLMELVQPVKALTPDEMTGEYDIIFYLTKTTQNESALKPCKEHLKSDGILLCMQNGLPEDAVIEVMGKEKVAGCVTGWGATYVAPGVSKLTSDPNHMTYDIGELDGQISDRIRMLEKILNHAGHVNVHTNLMGIRWTKLTSNSMFSGMSAVVGGNFGDVLDHPKAIRCSAHILKESVTVAKAAGVNPVPFQGDDVTKLTFATEKELGEKMPGIRKIAEHHRNI
ncbi:MAG: 2-dehydropantoate 2-reductase N-terminal domain-containing protein, partial [Dehalobacterium sp.]